MTNYVFIYQTDVKMDETSEESMNAWMTWFNTLGDRLVDGGNPFKAEPTSVVKNGGTTKEDDSTSGYTIVKANSLEEAVALAKDCPLAHAPGCAVRVYETMPM